MVFHIAVLGVAAAGIYSLKKEQEQQAAEDNIQLYPKQQKEMRGIRQIDAVPYGKSSGQQREEFFEGAISCVSRIYGDIGLL